MKKMILVDPNIYQNAAQKEMTKLDENMNRIFKSDLEESEKIKQYSQTLQRYLSFKQKTGPTRMVIEEEKQPTPIKDILKVLPNKILSKPSCCFFVE